MEVTLHSVDVLTRLFNNNFIIKHNLAASCLLSANSKQWLYHCHSRFDVDIVCCLCFVVFSRLLLLVKLSRNDHENNLRNN